MVIGLNHVTLAVRHLEASLDFYTRILGCRALARWPSGAYLLAGDVWLALIVDPNTRTSIPAEYTHIAFTVSQHEFDAVVERIHSYGAALWQENVSEGDSLYFVDPNGHKLEIHATNLDARLRAARENPWDGLELF